MTSFRSPVPKRSGIPVKPPLPVFESEVLEADKKTCPKFSGTFTGFNVIINKREDMVSLYTKGYFGKGSLSHGFPLFEERQRKRKELEDVSETGNTGETSDLFSATEPETERSSSNVENVVEYNSNIDSLEQLHLSLEEAFFLSFGVACLDVYTNDECLTVDQMWNLFQNTESNFVVRYVTYHHFRSKGWVVKPGIKFGCDFLLYKQGPPHYHASYVVVIISNVNDEMRNADCSTLIRFNRVSETAGKELLLCNVHIPEDFEYDNLAHLERCEVSEFLINRWDPAANREPKH